MIAARFGRALLTIGIAVVVLGLSTAACGGSDEPAASATSESPAEAPSPSSSSGSSSSSSGGAPASGTTVLTGTVGTPEDPDAFEIALLDDSGQPVTSLPAGDYTVTVEGVGAGTTGAYSGYGSVGAYRLTASGCGRS